MSWEPSELYTLAKKNLSNGERLALRYVEIGIELYPDWHDPSIRRETVDGWVVDETCSALTVVYRRTGTHDGIFGFVFRRT